MYPLPLIYHPTEITQCSSIIFKLKCMQSQKDFRHSPPIDKIVDVIQNCDETSNYYCSKDEYTSSFFFFGERQHDKDEYTRNGPCYAGLRVSTYYFFSHKMLPELHHTLSRYLSFQEKIR